MLAMREQAGRASGDSCCSTGARRVGGSASRVDRHLRALRRLPGRQPRRRLQRRRGARRRGCARSGRTRSSCTRPSSALRWIDGLRVAPAHDRRGSASCRCAEARLPAGRLRPRGSRSTSGSRSSASTPSSRRCPSTPTRSIPRTSRRAEVRQGADRLRRRRRDLRRRPRPTPLAERDAARRLPRHAAAVLVRQPRPAEAPRSGLLRPSVARRRWACAPTSRLSPADADRRRRAGSTSSPRACRRRLRERLERPRPARRAVQGARRCSRTNRSCRSPRWQAAARRLGRPSLLRARRRATSRRPLTGTAQILVEGDYDGVLEPDRHYLPVRPDLSDLEDALAQTARAARHSSRSPTPRYEELCLSGRYSYRRVRGDGRRRAPRSRCGGATPGAARSASPPARRRRGRAGAPDARCVAARGWSAAQPRPRPERPERRLSFDRHVRNRWRRLARPRDRFRSCSLRSHAMNELIAHRGPDGEGDLDASERARRLRAPPADDHRPRDRRPADARRRRQLDHLQRRDLQLPRAARRARRAAGSGRARTPR